MVDVVLVERSEPVVMSVAAEMPECIDGIDDIVVPVTNKVWLHYEIVKAQV